MPRKLTPEQFNRAEADLLNNVERMPPPVPQQDRITLRMSFVHEHVGDQPIGYELIASTMLTNGDLEAHSKRRKIGSDWQAFRLGDDLTWDDLGFVLVDNLEGKFTGDVNPSKEELEDIAKRVVEVGVPEETFRLLVYPGWPQLIRVSDPSQVKIRCQHGEAMCRISLYPK